MKTLQTWIVAAAVLSAILLAALRFAAADEPRDPSAVENAATARRARVPAFHGFANEDAPPEHGTDDDLKRLQGSWELRHGNEGKGDPTIHSVKTIIGNRETLRRYSIATGELLSERTVEFRLSRSGPVRVFSFHQVDVGASVEYSFVYVIDNDAFHDVTGLLHGSDYRDYSTTPTIWRWTRVREEAADVAADPAMVNSESPKPTPRARNAPFTATIKDAALTDIDETGGAISVRFGRRDQPTQLANVPLADGVRLVASHVIPTINNHMPFEWRDLKQLKGKVVSIRIRSSGHGIAVESISEHND